MINEFIIKSAHYLWQIAYKQPKRKHYIQTHYYRRNVFIFAICTSSKQAFTVRNFFFKSECKLILVLVTNWLHYNLKPDTCPSCSCVRYKVHLYETSQSFNRSDVLIELGYSFVVRIIAKALRIRKVQCGVSCCYK